MSHIFHSMLGVIICRPKFENYANRMQYQVTANLIYAIFAMYAQKAQFCDIVCHFLQWSCTTTSGFFWLFSSQTVQLQQLGCATLELEYWPEWYQIEDIFKSVWCDANERFNIGEILRQKLDFSDYSQQNLCMLNLRATDHPRNASL